MLSGTNSRACDDDDCDYAPIIHLRFQVRNSVGHHKSLVGGRGAGKLQALALLALLGMMNVTADRALFISL